MIAGRDHVRLIVDRAMRSALITDEEHAELREWQNSGEVAREGAVEAAALAVLRREAGREDQPIVEIARLGTPLEVMQADLLDDLRVRIDSHSRSHRVIRGLLVGSCGVTFLLAVAAPACSLADPVVGFSAGASAVLMIGLTFILGRLHQLSREAGDRLVEKEIAVKFLRLALSDYITTADSRVLDAAVLMFLGHHSPVSEPLGPEDLRSVAQVLGPSPPA